MKKCLFIFCFLFIFVAKPQKKQTFSEYKFDIMSLIFDQYERPFTILDIGGCDEGYYAFKIAEKYNSVVVLLDNLELLDICKDSSLDNIILLHERATLDCLYRMSECEHFDVILLLDLVSKFGDKCREVLDVVLTMGDHVILAVPSNDDRAWVKNISHYLASRYAKKIGEINSNNVYLIKSNLHSLKRKLWFTPAIKKGKYLITSNFEKKLLTKYRYGKQGMATASEWVPGINLITFKACKGVYPTFNMVKSNIMLLKNVEHRDWSICNMIIQGKEMQLIDKNDPKDKRNPPMTCSKRYLEKSLSFIAMYDPQTLERFFWTNFV